MKSLSYQNHENTYRRFPCGSGQDQKSSDFGVRDYINVLPSNSDTYGSSWMVYLLPYVEQQAMYDKMVRAGNSGTLMENYAQAQNIVIPAYVCPSAPFTGTTQKFATNPLVTTVTMPNTTNAIPTKVQTTTYVGISGMHNYNTGIPGYIETRYTDTGGIVIGGSGVMFPNSKTSIADIQDGTTNVMCVSENGDWVFFNQGGSATAPTWVRFDARSTGKVGFILGSKVDTNAFKPDSIPDARPSFSWGFGGTITDLNTPGMMTVGKWKMNFKKNPAVASQSDMATYGYGIDGDSNGPLRSSHRGGVQIALCDASVRFITDNVAPDIVNRLTVRDDGQAFEMP